MLRRRRLCLSVFTCVSLCALSSVLHADEKSPLRSPAGGRARGDAHIGDDQIRVQASQLPKRLPVDILIDDAAGVGVRVLRTETGPGGQLNVRWRERDGLPFGASSSGEFAGRGVQIVSSESGAVLLAGRFPLYDGDVDDVDDDGDVDDDDGDGGDDEEYDDDGEKLVVEFPLVATGAEPRIHGKAKFESESSDDELKVKTEIEIEDGTPGADYLVRITRPRPEELIPFSANLTPDEVVPPPVDPPAGAGGVGRFSFTTSSGELSFLIELSGLSSPEIATRIHLGAPGETGGVVATLEPGLQKEGTIVLDHATATQLRAGNLYVNVQTENHPRGEVRGQILPVEPETERIAILRANSRGDAKYKVSGSGGLPFGAVSVTELIGSRVDVFRMHEESRVLVLTGVVPEVTHDVPSGHRIRVAPRALLFGEVLVGQVRFLRLVVTNTGTKKLNVVRIELEKGTTSEFTIHGFDHVHLAPGASLTVRVSYAPIAAGFDHGVLVVRSNAQFANKVRVPLAGSGLAEREPNIEVAPRALSFGRVLVGSSRTLETIITNRGAADLAVRDIDFGPGTSSEFSLEGSSMGTTFAPVTLTPGSSVGVPVVYRPDHVGESTGTLLITSRDVDEPIVRVLLDGRGVAAPGPDIGVSPRALLFGDVLIGTARTLTTTLRNVGAADLVIEGIEPGVETSLDYTVVSEPTSFVLPAGASAPVEVKYMPTVEGFSSGTLLVRSNDADEPLVTVSLSGRGVTIEEPEIDVSPPALRFGEVFVGSFRTLEVTVANTGSASLEVMDIELGAGSSSDFALERDIHSVSVAPGAHIPVPVRFLPGGEGPAVGTLVISSDDGDEPSITVPLSGTGILREVPAILVAPESVNFGARTVGSVSARTITIRNRGASALEILKIELRSFSSRDFTLVGDPEPVTLAPGASIRVQVRYKPSGEGTDSGALAIASDDPISPEVVVSLLGIGLPVPIPRLEVAPLAVDFGDVALQSAAAQVVAIRNGGTARLELTGIALGLGTSSSFAVTAGASSASLNPGAEAIVEVTYTPGREGADSGTLRLYEPAGSGVPAVTVSLFGAAIRTSEVTFRRGDVDANRRLNLIDVLLTTDFLFGGRTGPACLKSSDSNDDGAVNITDVLYLLNYLFTGGPPPAAPHGACGVDPSPDDLPCSAHPACSG